MPLQNLPCKRCSARTDQLTLLVQLYGPEGKHWWENVFTVCTSCLQVGRYALNSVQETLYMDVLPPPAQPNKLEGGVVAILLMYGPLKAGAVQRRLREREGVRLNRHETEHLLELMGQKGLVAAEKADWTEKVVAMLLESNKQQACSKCGKGGVTSLYAQMRNVPRRGDEDQGRLVLPLVQALHDRRRAGPAQEVRQGAGIMIARRMK